MLEQSKNNKWKIIAIIFIILFLLETSFLIYAYNLGVKHENNKIKCANIVCADYDAFIYDDTFEACYCYLDNEIVKTDFLG